MRLITRERLLDTISALWTVAAAADHAIKETYAEVWRPGAHGAAIHSLREALANLRKLEGEGVMDPGMFDGLEKLAYIGALFLPLGIWKLVDILIWLFHHLRFQ